MPKVYLDHAATTPLDPQVRRAMSPFLGHKFGNPSSIHSWGRVARIAVEEARGKVAKALNCQSSEVYFTGSTTESANLAVLGLARAYKNNGKHLITTKTEHHAVLEAFKHLEEEGFEVTYIGVDKSGLVDPKRLMDAIRPSTILVSVMYANNEVGTIQPIKTLSSMMAAITERRGKEGPPLYFHSDAAAAKYLSWDVRDLGLDLMTLGPHKFYGPKGTGILYAKTGIKLAPIIFGGSQEGSLRPGTENVAGIVGAAKAVEIFCSEKKREGDRLETLSDRLITGVLNKIKNVKLTGHPTQRVPDIVSFAIAGVEGEALLLHLDKLGIAASSGSACTSGLLEPSHVLLAMGYKPEMAHGSLRLSLGKTTMAKDVDYTINCLVKIVAELRKMSPVLKS